MILKGLNPQQKSAVEYLDSPLFVSAGAGSGKTKVLAHKIAYLVKEKGIRPHRILAITFTKKAANEMAGRVEKMLSIKPMWISTFHSFCVKVLREDAHILGRSFDRRFVCPKNWYLSIDEKRDVIEKPINDLIDLNGWDIRKALKLLRKSNPPLLEWLRSPSIYQQRFEIADNIKALLPEYYSPKSCLYHYLHMAEGNFRGYLKGEMVWVKKYFYVLRPILACKWIEAGYGVVPMEFGILVDSIVTSGELKAAIMDLLWRKQIGQELNREPRIPLISGFIETELERLKTKKYDGISPKVETEKLDELFRWALEKVW